MFPENVNINYTHRNLLDFHLHLPNNPNVYHISMHLKCTFHRYTWIYFHFHMLKKIKLIYYVFCFLSSGFYIKWNSIIIAFFHYTAILIYPWFKKNIYLYRTKFHYINRYNLQQNSSSFPLSQSFIPSLKMLKFNQFTI